MKKILLMLFVALMPMAIRAQELKVKGSFDELKDETLLDAYVDFDNGIYKLVPEKEFAADNSDWEQIKMETSERFYRGLNKTLKLTRKAAVKTDAQNYTIEVEIINVDDRGNVISNFEVTDSEGKAIARVENLYDKGGRFGTFCNLMGDGLETTGEKIGRIISYSILKKKYIEK